MVSTNRLATFHHFLGFWGTECVLFHFLIEFPSHCTFPEFSTRSGTHLRLFCSFWGVCPAHDVFGDSRKPLPKPSESFHALLLSI